MQRYDKYLTFADTILLFFNTWCEFWVLYMKKATHYVSEPRWNSAHDALWSDYHIMLVSVSDKVKPPLAAITVTHWMSVTCTSG